MTYALDVSQTARPQMRGVLDHAEASIRVPEWQAVLNAIRGDGRDLRG